MMLIAHKIELKLNNKQKTYCAKACGVARFAYNWALAEWKNEYQSGGKPSEGALRRRLNGLKKEQFPWMLEVTKNAPQMAIIQLGQAFQNFFAKRAKHPTFRKKGIHDRFTLTNDQFSVKDSRLRIPHLGWVRLRESLRWEGKIMSATISRVANRWFVSITVQKSNQVKALSKNQAAVGIDLGVTNFVTLSTETGPLEGPKPHKKTLARLRRLSKSLSRKEIGSSNRRKARMKLSKLHFRIANIRKDFIHKLTTKVTEQFSIIGIEDLNVKGMLSNRRLSRSIADMGFYEFRRQLEYKAEMRSKKVVVADRWFASSKICSACGHPVKELPLSIREWTCTSCNAYHQRDSNAAKNLEKMAVSSTVTACGASSDGAMTRVIASHMTNQLKELKLNSLLKLLTPRPPAAHKGDFGHVLVIGGDHGMAGAVRMAGEASARVGAGLTSVATHPENIAIVSAMRPELMCHGIIHSSYLKDQFNWATIIVLGPGLGQSNWSQDLFDHTLQHLQPKLVDADGLNLLSKHPQKREDWILTPHVGEAARLLNCTTQEIQQDRLAAAQKLQQTYGGVIVLKGTGTIVLGADGQAGICHAGNPGMASGGMGDVLSGVIGGLLAQKLSLQQAAELGVCVHAAAGDLAAKDGERGLLALDLMPHLRRLVNEQGTS